jgi:hypothetical protein
MPTNDPKDPLEGKGEEMIPDRGIPFDDIDGSEPNDSATPDTEEPQSAENDVADLSIDSGASGDRLINEDLAPDENVPTPNEVDHFEESETLDPSIPEDAETDFYQPLEEYPDDGMGTAAEEAFMVDSISPELMDGGMSAGYPPTRDEDLTPSPYVSIEKPEPSAMSGAPIFSPESFEPPDPFSDTSDREELIQNAEHLAKPEMLKLLVTDEDIQQLWERADIAQKGVIDHIATIPLGQKMLNFIQNGKNELLGGKENYEEAERYINEVEYRVSFSRKLKSLSKVYTTGLYLYEIVWAVVLLLFLVLGIGVSAAFASAKMEGTPDQTYLLTSMVWGGFGGVIGALLALIKHIAIDQDFDKQHTWWYFSSPTMGVGMGAVVYLFLHVGLFSIVGADTDIASPLVIYVFAWLAGYQQNVFTDLVKRMMKTLMGEDLKAEKEKEIKPNFEVNLEDKT